MSNHESCIEDGDSFCRHPHPCGTTTPTTQAILPVTTGSIESAVLDLSFANTAPIEWDEDDWHRVRRVLTALYIPKAHSLPGDVGIRIAISEAIDEFTPGMLHSEKIDLIWCAILAALTPSALSGDAGEGRECEREAVDDAVSRLRGWLDAGEQYARAGSTMRLDVFVSIALAQLDGSEPPTAERLGWAIDGIKAHVDDELLGDDLRTLLAALPSHQGAGG